MLSTADVVNIPLHIIGGQTTPSSRYRWTTASPILVDISRTLSYEIQIPHWNNVSISCRFLILQTEGVQHKRQMESLDQMNVFEMNQIPLVLFYDSCTAKAEQWLHLIWLDHFLAAILYQAMLNH